MIGVASGDTLIVRSHTGLVETLRLNGIAAPVKGHLYYESSRHSLVALAYGKQVAVRIDDKDPKTGYRVAWIGTFEGVDVNGLFLSVEQVRRGMALSHPIWKKPDARLPHLQEEAKAAKRGLWAAGSPG